MKKRTFIGEFSIVPTTNPEAKVKQLNVRWCGTAYLEKFKDMIQNVIGRKIDDDELLFEITAKSPGYPNWFTFWPCKEGMFSKYLPAKELENIKEGKILVLKSKFGEIRLTAKQHDGKKFHEVYKELLEMN